MCVYDSLGNIYGTVDNPMEEQTHLKNKVLFNTIDAVRHNGYVTHVSIAFSQTPELLDNMEMSHKIILFVISQKTPDDSFQIVQRHEILPTDIKLNEMTQTFTLDDSTVYLEKGQFLGIGFGPKSDIPKYIADGNHYEIDLAEVNEAHRNNKPIKFNTCEKQIAISFCFVPTSGNFN
jgi:hypothetical protein